MKKKKYIMEKKENKERNTSGKRNKYKNQQPEETRDRREQGYIKKKKTN